MIGKKVEKGRPVPMALAKKILKAREKDGELHYEQKLAFEYVNKFATLSVTKAEELMKKLEGLEIARWKPRHGVKVADLLPETEEELKAIFSKESISLKKEEISKILDIVAEFR